MEFRRVLFRSSYWGPTQTRRAYYPGIESVTTAGHGGFIVSPELNELVDPEWRNDAGNYEEDSCWAIVAFTFPHLFTKRELKFANAELLNSYPDPWERLTGQKILRSEEHTSELQSLMRISYAVFCLKKKKKYNIR